MHRSEASFNPAVTSGRLRALVRRSLHSAAYFLGSALSLGLFFVALLLGENAFYAITGQAVSIWAQVMAALTAAFLFSPLVHLLQRGLDRIFFRKHVDTLAAIRHLGAGDLAQLPPHGVEMAVLQRICEVSHRTSVALDERRVEGGRIHVYPQGSTVPAMIDNPLAEAAREPTFSSYETVLRMPHQNGEAYLYLGPREDGWPTEINELEALKSLAGFAAMSLEHARLSHQRAEAARLDSLARVAGQLHSHDLKNRLNDLTFLAHNLESGKLDKGDVKRLAVAMGKVVGRMQTLMQRMADPHAPLNPTLTPQDIVRLLKDSVERRLWPEGVTVDLQTQVLPAIGGDVDLLRGVFENLFDNAVQAMNKQGKLTITVKSDGPEWAEVRVIDTGEGISEHFLKEQLFHLFSTSKPDGLGIGLYLSKRIIEAHQGEIRAESPGKGKGCTFIVRLPLWQGSSVGIKSPAITEESK